MAGTLAGTEKIRLTIGGLSIEHSANRAGVVSITAGVAVCVPQKDVAVPFDLLKVHTKHGLG